MITTRNLRKHELMGMKIEVLPAVEALIEAGVLKNKPD